MKNNKIIGYWLLTGVWMLVIQILLGGITRLTGSGLSITQWKPILGVLPPVNAREWQVAFEKYQEIGQFKMLNNDFTLSDFKFIYFWEWLHRNWARFISIVFMIPFSYFLIKKMIPKNLIPKLIILFILGLSQGLIGWIMVASGLNDTNLYVNHIKLAIHFISALFLISLTYWYALEYIKPGLRPETSIPKRMIGLNNLILILLSVQLCYGAFMAGLHAGTSAPTYPLINGSWFPNGFFDNHFFQNPFVVHFIHRNLATILFLCITLWTFRSFKVKDIKYRWLPFILVICQAILGVLSVLYSPKALQNSWGIFEWNAQLHQLVAMLLLLSMVYQRYAITHEKR